MQLSTLRAAQLKLEALAFKETVNDNDWSGADLEVTNGGTGASSGAAACSNLGALPTSGGTMTGALTLAGAPTINNHAANKAYVDALIAANDAMVYKGVINASSNPNYPAADAGHTYRISVAGKIGGGSGPNVEVGDILLCITDGSSAGNHATVGANWNILQVNIDGAVIGPAGATDGYFAQADGTSGRLVKFVSAAVAKAALAIAIADVSGLQAALDAKEPLGAFSGSSVPTSNVTLALTDAGRMRMMNHASARTFTIPPQASVTWAADTLFNLARGLAGGSVQVLGGSGVTVKSAVGNDPYIAAPGAAVSVWRESENTWWVFGAVSAS